MNHRKTKRHLEFESLESMALLSVVGMPMHRGGGHHHHHHHHHHGALVHQSPMTGGNVALSLSGTVRGRYHVRGGTTASFNGHGRISPVGRAHLHGTISLVPGGASGQLALKFGRRGTVFAAITGQKSLTTYTYTITGGTRSFVGDSGSGVSVVNIARLGAPHGHFSLNLEGNTTT